MTYDRFESVSLRRPRGNCRHASSEGCSNTTSSQNEIKRFEPWSQELFDNPVRDGTAELAGLADKASVLHESHAGQEQAPIPITEAVPALSSEAVSPTSALSIDPKDLPLVCPGCGAYSQATDSSAPGFYDAGRNDVQLWLANKLDIKSAEDEEYDIVANSLANADQSLLKSFGIDLPDPTPKQQISRRTS